MDEELFHALCDFTSFTRHHVPLGWIAIIITPILHRKKLS